MGSAHPHKQVIYGDQLGSYARCCAGFYDGCDARLFALCFGQLLKQSLHEHCNGVVL